MRLIVAAQSGDQNGGLNVANVDGIGVFVVGTLNFYLLTRKLSGLTLPQFVKCYESRGTEP